MTAAFIVLTLVAAQPRSPREWVGEAGQAFVRSSAQVEVLRLAPRPGWQPPEGPLRLRNLSPTTSRVVRDPALLARVGSFLLDDGAWGASRYGVESFAHAIDLAFRFGSGGQTLEVLVCLDAGLASVPWQDAEWVFELKAERALLDLALEVFPEDRALLWKRAQRVAPKTPAELLGPAAAIFAGADRAEALAVRARSPRHREIAELEVTGSQPLAPALLARLQQALLAPATYGFGPGKRCSFVPNVAFRVHKGAETAELILCFGCLQMAVNAQDASGRPLHLTGADFKGEELWSIAAGALGEARLEKILKQARP